MALNKFMHPRNIYKSPPDFGELAKTYQEFAEVAKTDVSGKVSIDFKDPHALRVLTKCLLKSDFNLDVVIPEDRLVPTLPLRLNYILWIEDLLRLVKPCNLILGIDIGTGACAIYPLLAAVKNKWHMVGTESDAESYKNALENVKRNHLQDLINLRINHTKTAIEHLFTEEDSQVYQFTMCNPPFYTNIQELWESRSPARPPPKNGFTGSPQELITEGGELQFCRQIIEESKKLGDKILIFTTMVGHKYNLKELIMDLKADGIKHTTTEFCQGRVTRWGLAWTYQDYDFSKMGKFYDIYCYAESASDVFLNRNGDKWTVGSPHETNRDKMRKKNIPIIFPLPEIEGTYNNFGNIFSKFKGILDNLKITHKIISKRNNEVILDIIAYSNTWSNQRRKRRLQKRVSESEAKIPKLDEQILTDEKRLIPIEGHVFDKSNINSKTNDASDDKRKLTNETDNKSLTITCDVVPLVHAISKICFKNENIIIEMEYLSGSAGKEGLHQIVQYIKNNWK